MTRRKSHKRSRQKAKFHKVRKSAWKNVQSQLFDSKNGDEERSDLSRPRTPESVLFESQHPDPLCDDQLSPEIIPVRLGTEEEDREIDARMIEQASPISSKLHLSMCDFKHGTKCTRNFPNLEESGERERDATKLIVDDRFDLTESYSFNLSSLSNEPNNNANGTADVKHDGRPLPKTVDETAGRNISGSPISKSSRSRDDVCTSANVPGLERGSFGVRSGQRKDHCVSETMEDCYLLNKTLSMNDSLVREINCDLDGQSSTVTGKLGGDRVSELAHFGSLRETDERSGSSARREHPDKKRRPSGGGKRLDAALERIGECLTVNWREFRKSFAYLRWTFRRACGEDAADRGESLLHGYRRFLDKSVSTLSLPVFRSSSPRRASSNEAGRTKREPEKGVPPESTTPPIGLVNRCPRTTLIFGSEDEGEAARHRPPASRADIADPLSEGMKKNKGCSFLLDPRPFSDETRQDGRIPESTIVPDVELSDRDGSPQKVNTPYS